MKRLQDLKKYVDLELNKLEDTDKRNSGIILYIYMVYRRRLLSLLRSVGLI
jgi:hypothetical protein